MGSVGRGGYPRALLVHFQFSTIIGLALKRPVAGSKNRVIGCIIFIFGGVIIEGEVFIKCIVIFKKKLGVLLLYLLVNVWIEYRCFFYVFPGTNFLSYLLEN